MAANILDGKLVAHARLEQIEKRIQMRGALGFLPPFLAVILVGDDNASEIYVKNKQKTSENIGIISSCMRLPKAITERALIKQIEILNKSDDVHGILIQLPLPSHISTAKILETLHPQKDVDGFHPENMGQLAQGHPKLRPCTPMGIMNLLEYYKINVTGKDCVVIGASNIVGKPMALELLNARATVSICHSKTRQLKAYVENAELIIAATGVMDLVDPDWLHPHHIVIDVGIHRLKDSKIRGDIDYNRAFPRVGWLTPVPGGIGPMTVASLMENTLQAAETLQVLR